MVNGHRACQIGAVASAIKCVTRSHAQRVVLASSTLAPVPPTMAAATPKRTVHWDTNYPSPSEFGSPSLGDDDSTASSFAPSTLEYVNSQLIAHGFAPAPGLCLDGASVKDSERVVKCLLSLLSQRMVCFLFASRWPGSNRYFSKICPEQKTCRQSSGLCSMTTSD